MCAHVCTGIVSLISSLLLYETSSRFFADTANMTDLVLKGHTVKLVGTFQQLWTKCGRDELSIVSKSVNHS